MEQFRKLGIAVSKEVFHIKRMLLHRSRGVLSGRDSDSERFYNISIHTFENVDTPIKCFDQKFDFPREPQYMENFFRRTVPWKNIPNVIFFYPYLAVTEETAEGEDIIG